MTIAFTNARLIDPEAGTDTIGTLVVDGGKIAHVGNWRPEPRDAKEKARRDRDDGLRRQVSRSGDRGSWRQSG